MKSIRRQRNVITLLNVILSIMILWFATKLMLDVVVIIGILIVVLFTLLIRQNKKYHNAKLIHDNCILMIPVATIILKHSSQEEIIEETVISTFGIMIGCKIYMWGLNGVWGVRLNSIEIKHKHMSFVFGKKNETTRVELLHGITDIQTVLNIKQRLWHETGIMATICDWQ